MPTSGFALHELEHVVERSGGDARVGVEREDVGRRAPLDRELVRGREAEVLARRR